MEPKPVIILGGDETVERMELLVEGVTKQGVLVSAGLATLQIENNLNKFLVEFDWVSTALYFDELFESNATYPGFVRRREDVFGIYECFGSSYLERVQKDQYFSGETFRKHRHFFYYNRQFCWHITALEYSIIEI